MEGVWDWRQTYSEFVETMETKFRETKQKNVNRNVWWRGKHHWNNYKRFIFLSIIVSRYLSSFCKWRSFHCQMEDCQIREYTLIWMSGMEMHHYSMGSKCVAVFLFLFLFCPQIHEGKQGNGCPLFFLLLIGLWSGRNRASEEEWCVRREKN